jgi:hypothetical protein
MDRTQLLLHVQRYAESKGITVGKPLGAGVHGSVFSALYQTEAAGTAIKGFVDHIPYLRERDAYHRLQKIALTQIRGCNIPQLIGFDDALLVIEMTVVARPFVLDFAGAYLDHAPDFSDEVMADWRAEKQEQFAERWRDVQGVLAALAGHGIHMLDVNPGNISFE